MGGFSGRFDSAFGNNINYKNVIEMINRNIAAFCAAFESVLASTNDVEKAIEIECSMDNQNEFDYDC